MANITCPQCSRFVDDSAKLCPGCKFNIKKYVKELKKKGSSVSSSISFGSVYNKTSASTDAIPELEFLKAAAPAKSEDAPVAQVVEQVAPAAPVYEAPAAPAYQAPAAPAYEAPAAPAYEAPAAAPAYEAPAASAYSYDDSSVVEESHNGVSSVDPASLFPKETTPFRPAYKPRVMSQGPVYDPNYKANHSNTHIEEAPAAPAYEAPAAPAYEAPAAPAYEAPAAPAYEAPAAPAYEAPAAVPVAAPVPAAPVPVPAAPAPAAPVPAAAIPVSPAMPATPAAAAASSVVGYRPTGDVPPEALLYQRPAAPYAQPAAAPAPAVPYAQPAQPYAPAAAYSQPAVPYQNYQAARQVQSSQPAAAYQQGYGQQPAPAASGLFESAALNCGVSGGGALSGEVSGPTILEKLRAEEEQRKANASIFESPNLRAAERELKNGTRQPAGGLHGEIDFDNYIAPERGSFGQATAYQIQQAAYVAAGAGGGAQSSIPPYAAQQTVGPGGLSYQIPVSPTSNAYASQPAMPAYAPQPPVQNGVPAFAAGPGMGNPYAPSNGAVPYITNTPAGGANPMLGGAAGNANPLLGGGV